jgi:hypothetical protein
VLYEPVPADALSPAIYPLRPGEVSHSVAYELTTVATRMLVRWTGGCGSLPEHLAAQMYETLVEAFDGFTGAQVFGATRMLRIEDGQVLPPSDPRSVRHGITEVPPMIRRLNPGSKIAGVVPIKDPPVQLDFALGQIISREDEYVTIVHPGQDYALMIQASPDDGVIWEAEYKWCLKFIAAMARAGFRSLLFVYGGGNTTEKEILAHAKLGLPVLLVADSPGKAGQYAADESFLERFPNVHAAAHRAGAIREALMELGALPPTPGGTVIPIDAKRSRRTA